MSIPWIEKYRPVQFENIILDPTNRQLFHDIIHKNYFPHLLFYGPPGTGKTTTIINLINEFQIKNYQKINKNLVIHLNASDDRGIDIIRNQIYSFVKSSNMFEKGLKFVILDEVDYITKNAQQALKYLLQICSSNVKFCLICNYISKIDDTLQSEFFIIRFNQLPVKDIFIFIKNIAIQEKLDLTDEAISAVLAIFQNDVRGIINFIQLNQNLGYLEKNIMRQENMDELHQLFQSGQVSAAVEKLEIMSIDYNIDKKHLISKYCNHVIRNSFSPTTSALYLMPSGQMKLFLKFIKPLIHGGDVPMNDYVDYFCVHMVEFWDTEPH